MKFHFLRPNFLSLVLLIGSGSGILQAAEAFETETGTRPQAFSRVRISSSGFNYVPRIKISKHIKALSSDPVVWNGMLPVGGAVVNLPVTSHFLRLSVYCNNSYMGTSYINHDDLINLVAIEYCQRGRNAVILRYGDGTEVPIQFGNAKL